MKRIRTTMSILTLAAASSLMTNAIAADNCIPKGTESSPFVIGFSVGEDGTTLKAVIYPVDHGKLGAPLNENDLSKGALKVNGERCGHRAIAVNRFWNHELFYTIEVMPGYYIRINIPHSH